MPAVLIRLMDSLGSIMLDTTSPPSSERCSGARPTWSCGWPRRRSPSRTTWRRSASATGASRARSLRGAGATVVDSRVEQPLRQARSGQPPALSVGDVVVGAGGVVVVVVVVAVVPSTRAARRSARRRCVVVVVVVLPPVEVPASSSWWWSVAPRGATKGTVSPRMVVRLVDGVADRLVQLRAAFQLWTAVVAGVPVSGWGTPSRMVAGRQTAPVMWRPLRRDDERAAVGLGRGVVVEGEVAQAVVDVGPAEVAAAEEDVGAGADHDVGPRLDELLAPAAPAAGSGRPASRCPSARRRSRCRPCAAPAGPRGRAPSGRSPRRRRAGSPRPSTW